MQLSTVFWWFGLSLAVLGVAMSVPMLAAVITTDTGQLSAYIFGFVLCIFLGAALIFVSRTDDQAHNEKGGIREVVLILVIWWVLVPLFAGIPFRFDGHSLVDAWYEAVTATTTTGAWLSFDAATSNLSGMIWRAQLQWLGGIVSISAAAAVFVRSEFIGTAKISAPFSRGESESYLYAFRSALLNFLPFYLVLTLFVTLFLVLFSVPLVDAIVIGLSLPATGGFFPATDVFTGYSAPIQLICFATLVLSGVSFVSVVNTINIFGRKIRLEEDRETPAFLFCLLLTTFIFYLTTEEIAFSDISRHMFNAASALTTNGFILPNYPALAPVLIATVIGGAAISTVGGLKLIRWIITFERAGQEVWKLVHPSGVVRKEKAADELAVWIHFIAFTIILAVLILVIGLYGHDLDLSMTVAVAAISNAGPILNLIALQADYEMFDTSLRIILAFGMIIGRLEMVIALALFNGYFWKS